MPAVNRGYGISTGTKEIRRPENMNNASVEEFFDKVLTVRLTPDRQALDIIDQTLLPGTVKRINLSTKEEIWEAIKKPCLLQTDSCQSFLGTEPDGEDSSGQPGEEHSGDSGDSLS